MAGHRGIKEHVTARDKEIWDRNLVKAREALDDARGAHRRGRHADAKRYVREARRHLTAHDRAVDRRNARRESTAKRRSVARRTPRDRYGRFI